MYIYVYSKLNVTWKNEPRNIALRLYTLLCLIVGGDRISKGRNFSKFS